MFPEEFHDHRCVILEHWGSSSIQGLHLSKCESTFKMLYLSMHPALVGLFKVTNGAFFLVVLLTSP